MPKLIHSLLYGIGTAVNLFPARAAMDVRPVTGDYFRNTGEHIRSAVTTEGPRIRKEAGQMELHLVQGKAN